MRSVIRVTRGLGALTLLTAIVGGAPLLLLRIGRLPAVTPFPEVLFMADRGGLLLGVLTIIAWVAWGAFTVSTAAELVVLLSGRRIRVRLPGLVAPRSLAAGLLLSVATMLPISAQAAPAVAAPVANPPEPVRGSQQSAPTPGSRQAAVEAHAGLRYTVQRGDDLWSLAEQFYGDGREWTRIVAANPIITSPDEIDLGWELVLPGVEPPADQVPAEPSPAEPVSAQPTPAEHVPAEPTAAGSAPPSGAVFEFEDASAEAPGGSDTVPAETQLASPVERIGYATAGISSLVAASLLTALATRRTTQLTARGPGRRITHPAAPQRHLEVALGQAQDPLTLRTLDLALRALGRHYRSTGEPLPALGEVVVTEERISFEVDRIPSQLPLGFHADSRRLWIGVPDGERLAADADSLRGDPAPYPALVCFGETDEGAMLLHDLETVGALGLDGPREAVRGFANALTLELTSSPWGRGQSVTVVDGDAEFATVMDDPTLVARRDLDPVLDEVEAAARDRLTARATAHPRDLRTSPDLAEAWRPHVLLIGSPLTTQQRSRVDALVAAAHVVVVAADPRFPHAELKVPPVLSALPSERTFRAQVMTSEVRDHLVALLSATASDVTAPAPWWSDDAHDQPSDSAGGEYEIRTQLNGPVGAWRAPSPSNVISLAARRAAVIPEEPAAVDAHEPVLHSEADDPTVLLVGPVGLIGARGTRPTRAVRQCIEYAAWLLEHPGATSTMMATALFVAEATRRSNVSRLRTWLGSDSDGELYLPDAYSGRIQLHPGVTSDWNRIQLLTVGGVDRAADANLAAVLDLVRGAPLADAAPGQWHWAEELRTDICSLIRDVGLVLGERGLDRGEIDLSRWAINRALVVSPEDERLLAARVRVEHRAGNTREVERLALRLVRSARTLNIDLTDETVTLLQQVMEGRPRSLTIN